MKIGACTAVLAAALFASTGLAREDPEPATVELGRPAPEFSVETAAGRYEAWTNFFGERGLIVVFLADEDADDALTQLARLGPVRRGELPILAVNVVCAGGAHADLAGQPPLDGVALRYDPEGAIARLYDIQGAPTLVAIDRDATVRILAGLGASQDERTRLHAALVALAEGREFDDPAIPAPRAEDFLADCPY